jgi:hypothetical protein
MHKKQETIKTGSFVGILLYFFVSMTKRFQTMHKVASREIDIFQFNVPESKSKQKNTHMQKVDPNSKPV